MQPRFAPRWLIDAAICQAKPRQCQAISAALLRVALPIRYHEVSREDGKYSFNSATRRGFKYIGVIDRSELLAYIEGGIDKFEKIVPEAGSAADLERVLQRGEFGHQQDAKGS